MGVEGEVKRFVVEFWREKGRFPTYREIMAGVGLSSTSHVHYYLKRLEEEGFVVRVSPRKFALAPRSGGILVPLRGEVVAGLPSVTDVDYEEVEIPSWMYKKGCYVVRVKGDSMMDMGITEGDLLVVEPRSNVAEDGEVVVAYLSGEGVTVKVFRVHPGGEVVLEPKNPEFPPIRVRREDVWIEGVVIGLLRRMKR